MDYTATEGGPASWEELLAGLVLVEWLVDHQGLQGPGSGSASQGPFLSLRGPERPSAPGMRPALKRKFNHESFWRRSMERKQGL